MRAAVAQNPWQKSTAGHRPNKWTPRPRCCPNNCLHDATQPPNILLRELLENELSHAAGNTTESGFTPSAGEGAIRVIHRACMGDRSPTHTNDRCERSGTIACPRHRSL